MPNDVTLPPYLVPIVQDALYYLTVLFGACVTQVLSLTRNFNGSQAFLKRFAPGLSDTALFRIDFAIVTIVGSVIGMILFQPNGPNAYQQAFLAGIGWVTGIQTLARSTPGVGALAQDGQTPGARTQDEDVGAHK